MSPRGATPTTEPAPAATQPESPSGNPSAVAQPEPKERGADQKRIKAPTAGTDKKPKHQELMLAWDAALGAGDRAAGTIFGKIKDPKQPITEDNVERAEGIEAVEVRNLCRNSHLRLVG